MSLLGSSDLPSYLKTKYGRFNEIKKPVIGIVLNIDKHSKLIDKVASLSAYNTVRAKS